MLKIKMFLLLEMFLIWSGTQNLGYSCQDDFRMLENSKE